MNSLVISTTTFFSAAALLCIVLYVEGATPTIQEDQSVICNFKEVCTIIDNDDYMTDDSYEELWQHYVYELDTFDMEELN